MKLDRRNFLLGAAASTGLHSSGGSSNSNVVRQTHKYVAACPPVVDTVSRKPGPYRVMVIGAHPDDADFICGCTAFRLVEKGVEVKFVACCNGSVGHHIMDRRETAIKRRAETLEAAKAFGLHSYDIYDWDDAAIPLTIEAREIIAGHILDFEPDIVITHRDCDYHVDHRTVGTHVKDSGYMLGCPHWIKGKKAMRRRPLILLMSDNFTVPRELRPDILIDADPYIDRWCDALSCQDSQLFEWLPWDLGKEHEVLEFRNPVTKKVFDIEKRNAFIKRCWLGDKQTDAKRFATAWRDMYSGLAVPNAVEAYEISEYGRPPVREDFDLLLG